MEEVKKRGRKSTKGKEDECPLTIEETFEALDALIDQLESGKGSLEDAFKHYEEGMKLVKSCSEKIEKIEKQILVLNGQETDSGNGPMGETVYE